MAEIPQFFGSARQYRPDDDQRWSEVRVQVRKSVERNGHGITRNTTGYDISLVSPTSGSELLVTRLAPTVLTLAVGNARRQLTLPFAHYSCGSRVPVSIPLIDAVPMKVNHIPVTLPRNGSYYAGNQMHALEQFVFIGDRPVRISVVTANIMQIDLFDPHKKVLQRITLPHPKTRPDKEIESVIRSVHPLHVAGELNELTQALGFSHQLVDPSEQEKAQLADLYSPDY